MGRTQHGDGYGYASDWGGMDQQEEVSVIGGTFGGGVGHWEGDGMGVPDGGT